MIASRVAALNGLLRSHDAGAQAIQAHSSSSADPTLDELDVWSEKATNRFAREEGNQPAKDDNDETPEAILAAGDHFHETHTGVRATQAHFLSSADPATGELGVWDEKAINPALFGEQYHELSCNTELDTFQKRDSIRHETPEA